MRAPPALLTVSRARILRGQFAHADIRDGTSRIGTRGLDAFSKISLKAPAHRFRLLPRTGLVGLQFGFTETTGFTARPWTRR